MHTKYVILIPFPRQHWLNEHACVSFITYIANDFNLLLWWTELCLEHGSYCVLK